MRRLGLIALLLSGCALLPPVLPEPRLAPSSFGDPLALSQRLSFVVDGEAQAPVEALLEIDADAVRLVALALGQRLLSLAWDGRELRARRDPRLPAAVDPARVLRDVQLAYWPAGALRAALPPGWKLEDAAALRTLSVDDRVAVQIRYDGAPRWDGDALLHNHLEGYRLRIQSRPLTTAKEP